MAECHDDSRATKRNPVEDDTDTYLLWLYHMAERQDFDDEEYERLYLVLMETANADKWKNSPVYPGVVDHVRARTDHRLLTIARGKFTGSATVLTGSTSRIWQCPR